MTRQYQGASLFQYAIIIALIAVCCVPAYFLIGDTITNQLGSFSNMLADNNEIIKSNQTTGNNTGAGPIISPGEIDGTSTDPKIQCENNACAIDFGDYVLNGIPNNFSEYIETAGASGGTDYLATILEELAKNAPVDKETQSLIERLADNGHGMAAIERSFNDEITDLISSGEFDRSEVDLDSPIDLSEGPNYLDFQSLLQELNDSLGTNTDPNYQNTLTMINILSDNINSIATSVQSKTSRMLLDADTNLTISEEDAQEYENFIHDGSLATDLDSAFICGFGNGEDNGYDCN